MALEDSLERKQSEAFSKLRGLRKPRVEDVFRRLLYLGPEDFVVEGYKRRRPAVAFNPGAYLQDGELLVSPRFIFDYYKYVSSVGLVSLKLDEVLEGRVETPVRSRIILWPLELWEFLGCEDPRVFRAGNTYYVLYTGKGYFLEKGEYVRVDVLGLAEYDASWRLRRRGYFTIASGDEEFVPKSNKDSAFIKMDGGECTMFTDCYQKLRRISYTLKA